MKDLKEKEKATKKMVLDPNKTNAAIVKLHDTTEKALEKSKEVQSTQATYFKLNEGLHSQV
ncbi:hypothetical protein Hamer_G007644 [Homarus americanus]|uniref:Uncharacterized protein n=1 Tax=Homarus americanus TaxID=6706 RepID=A0A8J5MR61_HOMAM|nr:hypothetical protein Hamer_G007644 [Homarus americanus]